MTRTDSSIIRSTSVSGDQMAFETRDRFVMAASFFVQTLDVASYRIREQPEFG